MLAPLQNEHTFVFVSGKALLSVDLQGTKYLNLKEARGSTIIYSSIASKANRLIRKLLSCLCTVKVSD